MRVCYCLARLTVWAAREYYQPARHDGGAVVYGFIFGGKGREQKPPIVKAYTAVRVYRLRGIAAFSGTSNKA